MTISPSSFTKQPYDRKTINIEFVDNDGNSLALDSVVSALMFDADDTDVSSTMISSSALNTTNSPPTSVDVQIKAGTAGEKYKLQVRVELTGASPADQIEEDLVVYIVERLKG
jgi:hypothetical protein